MPRLVRQTLMAEHYCHVCKKNRNFTDIALVTDTREDGEDREEDSGLIACMMCGVVVFEDIFIQNGNDGTGGQPPG